MKTPTKKLIAWLLIIVIVITASLIDLTGVVKSWWVSQDKHFHLAIFALFMVVTQLLFKKLSLFKISLITFALGLLIELLQAWFTHGHRHFDLNDIYFNLIGIALGLAVLLVYKGKRA
ncbi:MAG: VanZ family protein [Salinivirgaceae bacterium]|nr:VanZ family protein [Salinivirgaceae bacterium]